MKKIGICLAAEGRNLLICQHSLCWNRSAEQLFWLNKIRVCCQVARHAERFCVNLFGSMPWFYVGIWGHYTNFLSLLGRILKLKKAGTRPKNEQKQVWCPRISVPEFQTYAQRHALRNLLAKRSAFRTKSLYSCLWEEKRSALELGHCWSCLKGGPRSRTSKTRQLLSFSEDHSVWSCGNAQLASGSHRLARNRTFVSTSVPWIPRTLNHRPISNRLQKPLERGNHHKIRNPPLRSRSRWSPASRCACEYPRVAAAASRHFRPSHCSSQGDPRSGCHRKKSAHSTQRCCGRAQAVHRLLPS